MNDHNAPETCTESDDCNHTLHTRTHDRDSQIASVSPNEDAPEVEHVCPIHGVVASLIATGGSSSLDLDLSSPFSS